MTQGWFRMSPAVRLQGGRPNKDSPVASLSRLRPVRQFDSLGAPRLLRGEAEGTDGDARSLPVPHRAGAHGRCLLHPLRYLVLSGWRR
jgi:hypothetical protein